MSVILKSTKAPNINIPSTSIPNSSILNSSDFAYINILSSYLKDGTEKIEDFFYAISTKIPDDLFDIKFIKEKNGVEIKSGPLVNRIIGAALPSSADDELLKILGDIAIKEGLKSGITEIVALIELREKINNEYVNSFTSIKVIGY